MLPNVEFHGLWESLIYDQGIKENVGNWTAPLIKFCDTQIWSFTCSCWNTWRRSCTSPSSPLTPTWSAATDWCYCMDHRARERPACVKPLLRSYPFDSMKSENQFANKLQKCVNFFNKLLFFCRYQYVHLVEINSHSLFSKWFSESGKLVMKLFAQIREIVEHPQSLVCILIDEIESIAFERNSISSEFIVGFSSCPPAVF